MRKLKRIETKTTIGDAIRDAASEAQSLYDEMEEWRSNIEEKFSSTDKYNRVEEAAQALEDIGGTLDSINVPEQLDDVPITVINHVPYSRRGPSRGTRAACAANGLDAAVQAIREQIEVIENKAEPEPEDGCRVDLVELADEIEEQAEVLGSVDFPGMFG